MTKQDSFILIWMEKLKIKDKLRNNGDITVDNLNLRIDSGEYVCISGLFGHEKISFINILSCLNLPDGGKYIYDYNDISVIDNDKLDNIRSSIGFMFKNLNLVEEMTVYQNLELPLIAAAIPDKDHAIKEAASRLGLTDYLNTKANKLKELHKHKAAIARAIVVKPLMIIADEPADGLCQEDTEAILKELQAINEQGIALIMFTERKLLSQMARRHIVLQNGRIIKDTGNMSSFNREEGAV